jgi:tetratricopeptide (TPR) repeat protein
MSWWSRLTGGKSENSTNRQRVDYLSEALALERQGDLAAALTSYRLALRDKPDDHRVLQNMAIAFSRMGQLDDAIRCYRRALAIKPKLSGAHYGLAYLLLKRGQFDDAAEHLEAFLSEPPASAEAERWVRHARETLAQLRAGDVGMEGDAAELGDRGLGQDDLGRAELGPADIGRADLGQRDLGHTDTRPGYER